MPKEYRIASERNKSIGYSSTNTGSYSVALGASTIASGNESVALGQGADALGNSAISIGNNSIASGSEAISIGNNSIASGLNAISIGNASDASANGVIVINATGATFPAAGVERSNVYISNIFNLNGTSTGNLATVGGRLYGAMYCNVQTGQICVIAQ